MYKKMLAPLDGSELSECILEHIRAIALGCKVSKVVLLRVVEPIPSSAYAASAELGEDWVAKAEEKDQAYAREYLAKLAGKLKKEGIAVETATARGLPAYEILDYAKKNAVDIIVMSTHGRSGITRWVMGSVADRVLRRAAVPVLIIPPAGCRVS
jgi:nucleotide-binding universal stress UspA family protein